MMEQWLIEENFSHNAILMLSSDMMSAGVDTVKMLMKGLFAYNKKKAISELILNFLTFFAHLHNGSLP